MSNYEKAKRWAAEADENPGVAYALLALYDLLDARLPAPEVEDE